MNLLANEGYQPRGKPRTLSSAASGGVLDPKGNKSTTPDIAIVQVVKQLVEGVWNVEQRIEQCAKDMVMRLIEKTQGKGVINIAFFERLNAAFRQRMPAELFYFKVSPPVEHCQNSETDLLLSCFS